MKNSIFISYILLAFLSFYSCSVDEASDAYDSIYESNNPSMGNGISDSKVVTAKLRINKEIFDEINENRIIKETKGDSYSINYVKREGDFIQINLSYSGGCKVHDFEIIWDGIVYTDNPCHMNLLLIHNGNGDTCEALITETIIIDLDSLVGDVTYKDSCSYHIFSTYNASENSDVTVKGKN